MPVFRKGDKSILFAHVPKSGGSSVEQIFANSGYTTSYRDARGGRQTPNWLRRCSPQHMHASLLAETFRLERFTAIFMTVREPIARFRSEYAMRNFRDLRTDGPAVARWADIVFREYVTNPYHLDNHLRPQSDFYLTGSRVYRLENGLSNCIEDLNSQFGLDLDTDIPQVFSRTAHSGLPSTDIQIPDELAMRIRAFYASDYAGFGY
ncbi:MAG: sulfotransferase family 2 domain-containing protein [Thermomicrobiales bacterium]